MIDLFYKRVYKGVKSCPFCGGNSYFGIVQGDIWACQCEECKTVGRKVSLPVYYSHGRNALWSRMYRRSVGFWNKRQTLPTVQDVIESLNKRERKLP